MKNSTMFLTALFVIIGIPSLFAQAIINDRDGYVNVRKEANKQSKIIDTLLNGHLVFTMENEGNWVNIDYFRKEEDASGFIYKGSTKQISDYPKFKNRMLLTNKVSLSQDGIEITVTEKKFEATKHKFNYSKENKKVITLIDNKIYYGTDGELPKTQYHNIKVKIKNKVIELPNSATANLYEPSLDKVTVNYDKANDRIFISSYNSDGAGGYIAVWKIEKGKYKERYIFYGF